MRLTGLACNQAYPLGSVLKSTGWIGNTHKDIMLFDNLSVNETGSAHGA